MKQRNFSDSRCFTSHSLQEKRFNKNRKIDKIKPLGTTSPSQSEVNRLTKSNIPTRRNSVNTYWYERRKSDYERHLISISWVSDYNEDATDTHGWYF